ncbi:MAG: hypothetical protein A2X90_00920 [Deltaproteobacteria bacterium GWA2_65_63]|nr:MAG: hypothetical protein A2X90_00920 [Deltaproteobacteria bacterium GWA2_65_63]
MRVAIPDWDGHVSPVLDNANRCLLIEIEDGSVIGRETVVLAEGSPSSRALQLVKLRVDVLICCTITHALEAAIASHGVRVIRHICGSVKEVIDAFTVGGMIPQGFIMPGCLRRHREWEPPPE